MPTLLDLLRIYHQRKKNPFSYDPSIIELEKLSVQDQHNAFKVLTCLFKHKNSRSKAFKAFCQKLPSTLFPFLKISNDFDVLMMLKDIYDIQALTEVIVDMVAKKRTHTCQAFSRACYSLCEPNLLNDTTFSYLIRTEQPEDIAYMLLCLAQAKISSAAQPILNEWENLSSLCRPVQRLQRQKILTRRTLQCITSIHDPDPESRSQILLSMISSQQYHIENNLQLIESCVGIKKRVEPIEKLNRSDCLNESTLSLICLTPFPSLVADALIRLDDKKLLTSGINTIKASLDSKELLHAIIRKHRQHRLTQETLKDQPRKEKTLATHSSHLSLWVQTKSKHLPPPSSEKKPPRP